MPRAIMLGHREKRRRRQEHVLAAGVPRRAHAACRDKGAPVLDSRLGIPCRLLVLPAKGDDALLGWRGSRRRDDRQRLGEKEKEAGKCRPGMGAGGHSQLARERHQVTLPSWRRRRQRNGSDWGTKSDSLVTLRLLRSGFLAQAAARANASLRRGGRADDGSPLPAATWAWFVNRLQSLKGLARAGSAGRTGEGLGVCMTEKIRNRGIGRRNVVHVFLALPFLFALRGGRPSMSQAREGSPDDIVEVNGWILRRSDLS